MCPILILFSRHTIVIMPWFQYINKYRKIVKTYAMAPVLWVVWGMDWTYSITSEALPGLHIHLLELNQ